MNHYHQNEINSFGANIERGFIRQAEENGYVIESYDRMGLITPPIQPIQNQAYSAGDRVYFFMFDDGGGKILCPMEA